MRKHLVNLLLVLILLTGFSLMLYPTVSDLWNSMHQSRAIASYRQTVAEMDTTQHDEMLAAAQAYNATLLGDAGRFMMTDEERVVYNGLLDISGTGIMGYIEIPKIECSLPIYHGTSEGVLQIAVGHVEGSSLPIGGLGTHCVLSGHRGLPSAKLFTSLDKIVVGDLFSLTVLGEIRTYEVDQILTVLPEDVSALEIDPAQDYCTLVTCTPYGINSHRLLVRGRWIGTEEEKVQTEIHVISEAESVPKERVAVVVAVPAILLWILATILFRRKR